MGAGRDEKHYFSKVGLRAASGLSYCTLLLSLISLQAAVVSFSWGRDWGN